MPEPTGVPEPISDEELSDIRGWVADPLVCEINFEMDEWRALIGRLDTAEAERDRLRLALLFIRDSGERHGDLLRELAAEAFKTEGQGE